MNLTVTNKKMHDTNPRMFGLFFEDINYAGDGGIYAEMIENRSFEFYRTTGTNDAYCPEYDGIYGWYKFPADCPFVALETRTAEPLTDENPHYLHVRTLRANSGFTNKSYDGLNLRSGLSYHYTFWMNAMKYDGCITVSVYKDKDMIWSEKIDAADNKGWTEYKGEFFSRNNLRGGKLVITLDRPGEADFDFISLFPGDAISGVFRADLANMLRDIHPGFLRFPGGCIVEGNSLENRYRWKNSVGDVKRRRSNWNRWSVHGTNEANNYTTKFPHYNQTLGLGYFEYFLLCEYIGAKALPVCNVGLACQYQCHEWVETTDPAFREFVDDALDLIEFANGDTTTKWGALRAEMGHPLPFNLEYLGIGNEQWQTEEVDFFERYRIFEQAIHEKYPEIKLIGSAGPDVHTERYDAAWHFYHENEDKPNFAYAIDEHYYMSPEWFLENTHFYDDYDRKVKVFSGEYAAHPRRTGSEKSGNTLLGALSEAAFLTGVMRNCDVVVMSSYAPLFAREGFTQWAPDMIWFDGMKAYGSPSYYVQKMYANNVGTYTLKTSCDTDTDAAGIYYSASFDEKTKGIILRLVNTTGNDNEITLDMSDFGYIPEHARCFLLTGDSPSAFNSLDDPHRVETHMFPIRTDTDIKLPGYSFITLLIPTEDIFKEK